MKKLLLAWLLSILLSSLFFVLTNPEQMPVGLLMIPVVLIFFVITLSVIIFFRLTGLFSNSKRRRHGVAVMIGTLSALFIVFQSTGGVVLSDLILMGMIFLVACLYISKY
jgi:hypothetical protein